MKDIAQKLREMKKHDVWSDFVTGALGSVGITQEIRDIAQPAIDKGKDLLPVGGAIPNPQVFDANRSNPEITNYAETTFGKLLAPKIGGVPVLVVGLGLIVVIALARK